MLIVLSALTLYIACVAVFLACAMAANLGDQVVFFDDTRRPPPD